MVCNINSNTSFSKDEIIDLVNNFHDNGVLLVKGNRNEIKVFESKNFSLNIKSFKIPHFINKIAYRYFRKSKARRSFEYATILLQKGIGTPQPIAFLEKFNWLGLVNSFYVSEQLETELTFRDLDWYPDFPDHENILRQFTKFTFSLHEKKIFFLDHSAGNTLIKKMPNGKYEFFLVDLNRMAFDVNMDFNKRMQNFSRLTHKREMVEVMSEEYAKYYNESSAVIFEKMWFFTNKFQEQFLKRRKLKKQLKFWKS
ncbi:hypothetical protein FVB9288_01978 [Flavobacterium sp. CECT 9288]|uniref:lipopolysaccharide kinase InaA family protein n=1 Tax=Flavobacterium sp. CECT 9288 TaxID=2845819 RepID=UPI001E57898B|nr:lipopolysaccharide kinase InaA family protein [Flavobacterium sp. CECT 9288]CAH0336292.1 hypothetical protein FVB9288_01978 [Flavobacterium sp. CECT 9288]